MRFKRFIVATLALVAGMLLVAVTVLALAQMDVTVKGRGVVKTAKYTLITPAVGGLVLRKLKKSGDTVVKGEVLAELDTTDVENAIKAALEEISMAEQALVGLRADIRRAGERVRGAEARLKEAESAVSKLKTISIEKQVANAAETVTQREIRLDQAKKEVIDARDLAAKGLVSKMDLEKARAQELIAQSELKIARNRLEMVKDSLKRDLEAAEATVQRWASELRLAKLEQDRATEEKRLASQIEKARLRHQALKLKLAEHTYRAPMTGELVDFDVWPDQRVGLAFAGGASVGKVIDTTRFKFETYVRQIDAPWIRLGKKAYIELDAYPYRKYDYFLGKVSKVGSEASYTGAQDASAQGVEIEIDMDEPRWPIRPKYQGNVEIVVGRASVMEWLLGLYEPEAEELKTSTDGGGSEPTPPGPGD